MLQVGLFIILYHNFLSTRHKSHFKLIEDFLIIEYLCIVILCIGEVHVNGVIARLADDKLIFLISG